MKSFQENSIDCLIISFAVSSSLFTVICFKFGCKFGKQKVINDSLVLIKDCFLGTAVLWVTTMFIIYSTSCQEPYCLFFVDKILFKKCCDGDLF